MTIGITVAALAVVGISGAAIFVHFTLLYFTFGVASLAARI
jgi:hypothetical protein